MRERSGELWGGGGGGGAGGKGCGYWGVRRSEAWADPHVVLTLSTEPEHLEPARKPVGVQSLGLRVEDFFKV